MTVLSSIAGPLTRPVARAEDQRLRAIVETHFDVLWRLLRRLGVPEPDMDDAVQEVIWVIAKKLAQVEPGSERAFVLSTACRVASTLRRTLRRRRETGDGAFDALIDAEADPENLLEQRRARALLDATLLALPIELRSVFVLYELERCTLIEIAETLELAQGTVASRLRRARALFAAEIEKLEQRRLASRRADGALHSSRGTGAVR